MLFQPDDIAAIKRQRRQAIQLARTLLADQEAHRAWGMGLLEPECDTPGKTIVCRGITGVVQRVTHRRLPVYVVPITMPHGRVRRMYAGSPTERTLELLMPGQYVAVPAYRAWGLWIPDYPLLHPWRDPRERRLCGRGSRPKRPKHLSWSTSSRGHPKASGEQATPVQADRRCSEPR